MESSIGTRFLALVVSTASLGACAPTSLPQFADPHNSPEVVAKLKGCWQFTLTSPKEAHLPLGLVVRLDTVQRDSFNPNRLRLAVDTPLALRDRRGGWGLLGRSNEFAAYWGDGFTGLHLRLAVHNDSLHGRATRTVDFPAPRSSFLVAAKRVECPNGL
jgi:hypothetical protein